MALAALLVITSFFSFQNQLFSLHALLKIHKTFSYNLYSYTLHACIVDIEKPDGICSLTFNVDKFSGLILNPSIFTIKHSRSA